MLEILVENQARINFGKAIDETKGINGKVWLGNKAIESEWSQYRVPLHEASTLEQWIDSKSCESFVDAKSSHRSPSFFKGTFDIESESDLAETFLELKGWRKGVAWINGFNLGRYWPVAGPQVTLYVPKVKLRKHNTIVVMEHESSPCASGRGGCHVELVDQHIVNGVVPDTL